MTKRLLPLALLLLAPAVLAQEVLERPSLPERSVPAAAAAAASEPALEVEAPNSNDGTVGTAFRVDQDGGLLAPGVLGIGTIPAVGNTSNGVRMMWYPYRGTFRAGSPGGPGSTAWDDANMGFYSWAGGYNTIASAYASFAFGDQVVASGTDAAGFGASSFVSGTAGFSAGANNVCSGFACTAIGYEATAAGQGSVALGYRVTADANYSVALGYRASANGRTGAFVISDASTTDSTEASANNQFMSRFAGGYRLFTNSSETIGVSLAASGNSWSTISDSTRKESIVAVNGEGLLDRLAELPVSTWRYRAQEDKAIRHVGPMAQDWQRFVAGPLGLNADSTVINQADFDGVNLAGVIALEARTRQQAERIEAQAAEIVTLRAEVAALRQTLMAERAGADGLRATVAAQAGRLDALDARLGAVLAALDAAAPEAALTAARAD